jgi:transcriptional regulator with XRE-family HTH domain
MGVSTSYLSNRLRDKYPFTLNDVEAISRALKLDLVEFISAAAQHAIEDR